MNFAFEARKFLRNYVCFLGLWLSFFTTESQRAQSNHREFLGSAVDVATC